MTSNPITTSQEASVFQVFSDLQRCEGLDRIKSFEEPILPIQERIQTRAKEFLSVLEKNLATKTGDVSHLKSFLLRTLQMDDIAKNAPVFAKITKAFFKQAGYFKRLFSKEAWEEWTENRTPLGKVFSQFEDFMQSNILEDKLVNSFDTSELQQANKEAKALLNTQDLRKTPSPKIVLAWEDFYFLPKSSCAKGLLGGTVASFATKDPLPLLVGLSQCLPNAVAQQKVGNEFQVNTYTTSTQQLPSTASFPNGNFVVTWQDYGRNYHIYGQLFNSTGFKIGTEFQISTNLPSQYTPSPASTFNNEKFVVTWAGANDGNLKGVFGQLFTGNASKIGTEFQVNTNIIDNQENPSVAGFPNGNFVVTWSKSNKVGYWFEIFGQLFDANASKIGNEFQVNTYTANEQRFPSVVDLSNGNFVVTWESLLQDGSNYGIYGQLFDGTQNKIGSEFQVNTYTNDAQEFSSLASFPNGNFVVTWSSAGQDGSGVGIYGQLFNANASKIQSEFQVNTYINSYQIYPSIANLQNNFVVTWDSEGQGGPDGGIYGQLFDSAGNKTGSEFRVNTYTQSGQFQTSVASLTNGNFVVVWQGYNDPNEGIYGQIFHDNITFSSTTSTNPNSQTTSHTSTSNLSSSSTKVTCQNCSDPKNRFLWLWLLLGGTGGASCIGLTGYLIYKNKSKKDSTGHASGDGELTQGFLDENVSD